MKDLIEILTWCRGAGTSSESEFVRTHISSIEGIWCDTYGNYHKTIGSNPEVMWSCHTDTVTRKIGRQNVKWVGKGILGLNNPQQGQCLGADDGAGLWIMLQLIKAGKEGHYVFHRDEEIGGLGSSWIAKNNFVLPNSIKFAIAMDRCGTRDIITHQGFQRTASDKFAASLADRLPMRMIPDDTGVFTDTANYVDIIAECTNLAVGYERNHGSSETLDTNHLRELRDSLLKLDVSRLEVGREPGEVEYGDYYGHSAYYGGNHATTNGDPAYKQSALTSQYADDEEACEIWDRYIESGGVDPLSGSGGGSTLTLSEMVNEAPDVAARLIEELGVTMDEFRAHVFALTGRLLS